MRTVSVQITQGDNIIGGTPLQIGIPPRRWTTRLGSHGGRWLGWCGFHWTWTSFFLLSPVVRYRAVFIYDNFSRYLSNDFAFVSLIFFLALCGSAEDVGGMQLQQHFLPHFDGAFSRRQRRYFEVQCLSSLAGGTDPQQPSDRFNGGKFGR